MTLQRPERSAVPNGDTFQNLVNRYLCSRALQALNRRHLGQVRRGHVRPLNPGCDLAVTALQRWLHLVADSEFGSDFDWPEPGHPRPSSRYRLDPDKLADSMRARAAWVLQHWDPTKVERRSAGGSHGRATGVIKGPPPKFTVAAVLPYYHLPPAERKARVLATSGMSPSRFYQLLRQVPDAMERVEQRRRAEELVRPSDEELEALLTGDGH